MEQRVSLITLGVRDMAQAAAFYEALGWARVAGPDGVIAFDLIHHKAVMRFEHFIQTVDQGRHFNIFSQLKITKSGILTHLLYP